MNVPSPAVLCCSPSSCVLVLTENQGRSRRPATPRYTPTLRRAVDHAGARRLHHPALLPGLRPGGGAGCIYDRVLVNTGKTDVKFCGPTANGLTLNSTGNVMELSFNSDFSVQKRGFSVSFRHVALRNQKVTISHGNGHVTQVSGSVSIPTLSHLTLCFELERTGNKKKEWIFTYSDSSNNVALSLGSDQSGMKMIVDGVECPIDSILSSANFTSAMKPFCVLWTSSNGRVAAYFNGNYSAKSCSASSGHSVPGGGQFKLGGQQSFKGNIYNLRLWDYAMTLSQLNALSCDTVGNVIDWDNNHWSIQSSMAQTDTSLSCSVSPPSNTPLTPSCDSPGLGCPAQSTDSTNTIHATNAITHALQTTSSTTTASSATTNLPATNPTTHVAATTPLLLLVTTNHPATNPAVTAASSGAPNLSGVHLHASDLGGQEEAGWRQTPGFNQNNTQARVLSQESSPYEGRDDASAAKEPLASSSSLMSSSSVLSNRKNKPIAPQWSLLSGRETQTVDEFPSGSEVFAYELPENADAFNLYEFDAAYVLDEPATVPPAFIDPNSFNRSGHHGASLPAAHPLTVSEGGGVHNDSESPVSVLAAGSELSLSRSQDGLMPEAEAVISRLLMMHCSLNTTLLKSPNNKSEAVRSRSPNSESNRTLDTQSAQAQHGSTSALIITAAPEHASGLDYTHHSTSTHPNTEHPDRGMHSHPDMHTHPDAHHSMFLNAKENDKEEFVAPLANRSQTANASQSVDDLASSPEASHNRISKQPINAPVILNPLHTSGLNAPSYLPASRSPNFSSIHGPGQGLISGLEGPTPPGSASHTAGLKNNAMSNHSGGFIKGEDVIPSPPLPVVVTAHRFITTKSSTTLKAVSLSASLGGGSAAEPAGPCQCKHRFHFTCLCGLSSGNKGLFFKASFQVEDGAELTQDQLERAVGLWLNQTFQNWTQAVYVDSVSYSCQALLLYYYISNQSGGGAELSNRLSGSGGAMGAGLQLDPASTQVTLIENCPEENPLHYRWPESRPTVTQMLPCFPNKEQSTSRTCLISPQNLSSYWSVADISNCTDIDTIEVSAENAAEVAVQLAVITDNELSEEEVSKVVSKVKQLVAVARINSSLAETVVTIISNVMTSAESTRATTADKALKTVDELVQKMEFQGSSISITSRHLAVGISTLNTSAFNGTSFSAFMAPNSTHPQIDFESERSHPLAQVLLPPSLLYVVASSVGNFSIRELTEPVEITIAHLSPNLHPVCMFWDFSMNSGVGGWSPDGCRVSADSTSNRTVCLCDHLTHFGILMDISGAAAFTDPQNNRILTFITYIGCGISAIFSAATLLTYVAFEKLRRDYPSKILMNLSTSLLFLNLVFLLDGWLASLQPDWLCLCVAVFLHYFLLTTFTWMGLESIHMYIALVKVFNTYIRRYILKFCIVGWVAVDKNSYGVREYGRGDSGESSKFCFIKNSVVFYTTCVGYFCLVFLLNVAMFIVVMMQICGRNGKRSNRTLREEVLRNLRSVVSLTFLLGMTWSFALFAWGPVYLAFTYLFSIFNSLQENVQKQWRRFLCCGRFRLSDNSGAWIRVQVPGYGSRYLDTVPGAWIRVQVPGYGSRFLGYGSRYLDTGPGAWIRSFGSSTANWTSKAKATLNPFSKRHSNT
ncbi:Adhesion G-protein coupled receptor G6, partial [Dissostichus eleginoides]